MPTFDYSQFSRSSKNGIGGDTSKILAVFNNTKTDSSTLSKNHRFSIGFKSKLNYEQCLSTMASGTYNCAAGADLANIFMPFQTSIGGNGSGMPTFHTNVIDLAASGNNNSDPTLLDLLPFYWDGPSGSVFDLVGQSSGWDSMQSIVSSDSYYGDSNRFRDSSNIRSIGLRLPLIGVGWGYDLDGNPFPSGSAPSGMSPSGSYFAGGVENGWEVDPTDYIAAPIDFRYDTDRHVWATTASDGFWAVITGTSGLIRNFSYITINPSGGVSGQPSVLNHVWISGIVHAWSEVTTEPDGSGGWKFVSNPRRGTYTNNPAMEANGLGAPISSLVFMRKVNNFYRFSMPIPLANNVPGNLSLRPPITSGSVAGSPFTVPYQTLSVVDMFGRIGFDYPRFH